MFNSAGYSPPQYIERHCMYPSLLCCGNLPLCSLRLNLIQTRLSEPSVKERDKVSSVSRDTIRRTNSPPFACKRLYLHRFPPMSHDSPTRLSPVSYLCMRKTDSKLKNQEIAWVNWNETESAIPRYSIFAQNFSSPRSASKDYRMSIPFKLYLNIGSLRAVYKENAN